MLRTELDAEHRRLREAGTDHFYGAWKGGGKSEGGRPSEAAPGKDAAALQKEMEAKWPGSDWSAIAKLDPALQQPLVEEIDGLMTRYGPVPNFRGVRVEGSGNPGVLAEVKRLNKGEPGSAVFLYGSRWQTPGAMQKEALAETAKHPKWSTSEFAVKAAPKGTEGVAYARAVVAHEMGHEYLGLNLHSRLGANRDAPVRKELEPFLHDKFFPKMKTAHVSQYARRNPHEAWAELWTAANGHGASQSHFTGELRTILDKHYPPGSSALKEAATDAVRDLIPMGGSGRMCGWAHRHPEADAIVRPIAEAGSDHFYGAWKGGSKAEGGGPAKAGKGDDRPELGSAEAFYAAGNMNGRSKAAENAARFDALPDTAPVWVFHATGDKATADSMMSDGLRLADLPQNLARQRYAAGEYAEFAPGAGTGQGTYVGGHAAAVEGYGRNVIAMRVQKRDLVKPPEATGTLGQALADATVGAMVRDVNPSAMVRIPYTGRIQFDTYEALMSGVRAGGIREASDDHFHGAWKGGAKGEGGRPEKGWTPNPSGNGTLSHGADGPAKPLTPPAAWSGIENAHLLDHKGAHVGIVKGASINRGYAERFEGDNLLLRGEDGQYRLIPPKVVRRVNPIREGSDDHFYGAWKGGKASAGGGPAYSGETRSEAARLFREASAAEPKVTADLQSIVGEVPGARLDGLKHKLKTEQSLSRKIHADTAEKGSAKVAADGINDHLRYTMVAATPAQYTGMYETAHARMTAKGYKPLTTPKDFWAPDGKTPGFYQGVNAVFVHPSGQRFELQFHTQQSLSAKGETHKLYEKYRTTSDAARQRTLGQRMVAIQTAVGHPNGWPPNLPFRPSWTPPDFSPMGK
jgi:hypothetical protein